VPFHALFLSGCSAHPHWNATPNSASQCCVHGWESAGSHEGNAFGADLSLVSPGLNSGCGSWSEHRVKLSGVAAGRVRREPLEASRLTQGRRLSPIQILPASRNGRRRDRYPVRSSASGWATRACFFLNTLHVRLDVYMSASDSPGFLSLLIRGSSRITRCKTRCGLGVAVIRTLSAALSPPRVALHCSVSGPHVADRCWCEDLISI
jgi:hypothetical protein